jgi:hypothetical protein
MRESRQRSLDTSTKAAGLPDLAIGKRTHPGSALIVIAPSQSRFRRGRDRRSYHDRSLGEDRPVASALHLEPGKAGGIGGFPRAPRDVLIALESGSGFGGAMPRTSGLVALLARALHAASRRSRT